MRDMVKSFNSKHRLQNIGRPKQDKAAKCEMVAFI